jgi:uncharacterized cupin superfamily protein
MSESRSPAVSPVVSPSANKAAELAASLIRNFHEVPMQHLLREPLYDARGSRLAQGTAARKLGASYDELAPGKCGCPYHLHHAQEEMFIVLSGQGTLRVAGERLPIRPGDVIFIPPGPDHPHQILNTGTEPLKYLSISTRDTPEICEYPDSGKFLATANGDPTRPFEALQRSGQDLDYWDGEP